MGEVRCPRCGEKISAVVIKRIKGRRYVYVDHYLGYKGGRSRHRECYLGPVEMVDPSILALRRERVNRELSVSLSPAEIEAFMVKAVERIGKRKYRPEEHGGLTWEQINEAWASLKSKMASLKSKVS